MSLSWSDFFAGFFLANAIPHLVMALMDINFRSGFGFGKMQNIAYSVWNLLLAGGIVIYFDGTDSLLQSGMFWGVASLLLVYALSGRYFYLLWNRPEIDTD